MKKLLILPILLASSVLSGQISLGVKGGITHSWLQYTEGSYDETADLTVWGANTAVTFNYRFSRLWSLQAEPGWVQRGSKCFPGYVLPIGIDAIFSGNYVTLPLMAQIDVPIYGRLQVFAAAGPSISWLASAKLTRSGYGFGDADDQVERIDFKTDTRYARLDYGATGVAGLGLRVGPGTIQLDTRYYVGIKDVNKALRSRSRNLDFRVGYVFTW